MMEGIQRRGNGAPTSVAGIETEAFACRQTLGNFPLAPTQNTDEDRFFAQLNQVSGRANEYYFKCGDIRP
jgi:hypothetical protein